MDSETLKNFLVVAREGNITRAAQFIHITQPTLSRQMQNLEQELGRPLLIRGKRHLSLTPGRPAVPETGGRDPGAVPEDPFGDPHLF